MQIKENTAEIIPNIKQIVKEENNDSIILNKDDKENINSLNISSSKASSSNRLKNKKSKTIEQKEQINIIKSDQKEFKLEELDEPNIISIPFNKNKINKIIINFDDLIEFDSKFDNIIIFLSSISNNNIDLQPSNECSEFFSFYFHSSLNNIFGNFFSTFSLNFSCVTGIKIDESFFKSGYSVISGDLNVDIFVLKK